MSDRLQVFMLRNNYISRDIQKGFLAGMPGCIEHTFTLLEALRDAKESHRQIVITWLDLANAYGSIRHNLIQFALNWFHVPKLIQELIFDYYEKLCAMIFTNNWSTGFFLTVFMTNKVGWSYQSLVTLGFSRVVSFQPYCLIVSFSFYLISYSQRNVWVTNLNLPPQSKHLTKHMQTISLSLPQTAMTCKQL